MAWSDSLKNKYKLYGGNEREANIIKSINDFDNKVFDSPNYKRCTIIDDTIELSELDITFAHSDAHAEVKNTYKFQASFNSKLDLQTGYYLKIKEPSNPKHISQFKSDIENGYLSENSKKFIDLHYSIFKPYINDLDKLKEVILENEDLEIKDVFYIISYMTNTVNTFYKGDLKRCDYKLKWIADGNPDIIYERWVYKSSTVKNNDDTSEIVLPANYANLIVPRTEVFQRTFTEGKRLMIGYNGFTEVPMVYKIDGLTDLKNGDYESGTIDLQIVATEFIPSRDDKDRFIADILGYNYEYELMLNTPSSLELNINDTIQIDISVYRDNDGVREQVSNPILTYLSSDENIVTIDENGLITAIDDGNANIIVSGYDKESQININVSQEIISNKYIKSSNENYDLATQQGFVMYYFTTFVDGEEDITDTYNFEVTSNNGKFSYEVMKNKKTLKITPSDYACNIHVVITSINHPELSKEIDITVS